MGDVRLGVADLHHRDGVGRGISLHDLLAVHVPPGARGRGDQGVFDVRPGRVADRDVRRAVISWSLFIGALHFRLVLVVAGDALFTEVLHDLFHRPFFHHISVDPHPFRRPLRQIAAPAMATAVAAFMGTDPTGRDRERKYRLDPIYRSGDMRKTFNIKRRAEGAFGRCTEAGCQRAGTARPGERKERRKSEMADNRQIDMKRLWELAKEGKAAHKIAQRFYGLF